MHKLLYKDHNKRIPLIDAHRGGGRGERGAPHVPPIKIFEKPPHKN